VEVLAPEFPLPDIGHVRIVFVPITHASKSAFVASFVYVVGRYPQLVVTFRALAKPRIKIGG